MTTKMKRAEELTVADLRLHPVWEYVNDDQLGEIIVVPVRKIPVETLSNRLVGTKVTLANGTSVWATLTNVEVADPSQNNHFLALSVAKGPEWFHLARYHDPDYEMFGPKSLAAFLGLAVTQVFPITYDIRPFALGEPDALTAVIPEQPHNRLSRGELLSIAARSSGYLSS